MKRSVNRGFTLIELLVVIAIIAILAAILFPVFAQAKLAAKGAASLSNVKQESLAELMYTNDYDDAFSPACVWIPWAGGSAPPTGFACFGPSIGCANPWTYLLLPYVKTTGIIDDPLAPSHFQVPSNQTAQDLYTPTYGFDFTALAPYGSWDTGDGSSKTHIVTSTQPHSPSNLVMMYESHSLTDIAGQTAGGAILFSPNAANVAGSAAGTSDWGPLYNSVGDAPNCFFTVCGCLGNWGVPDANNFPFDEQWEGFFTAVNGGNSTPVPADQTALAISEGEDTGGISSRANGGTETTFTDGHAKSMRPGALAAGTNWSPVTNAGNLQFIGAAGPGAGPLPSNYMWAGPYDGG